MEYTKIKFDETGHYFDGLEHEANYVHVEGIINDYTLCSATLDGDEMTMGGYDYVRKKISCPDCIRIINLCRSIKRSDIKK